MGRRLLPLAFVLLLGPALAGCGGNSGRDVVARATSRLGDIKSGTLHLELLVTPRTVTARNPFGFRLDGPFRFGSVPTARIRYTQIANGKQGSATFVLERSDAYALVGGRRRDLPADQVAEIRRAAQTARTTGGSVIDLSSWIDSSKTTSCPDGGGDVQCVRGDLDPVETANGLIALAQAGGLNAISGTEADRLKDAVRKANFFVMAGKNDGLLRDLRIDVSLALDVPKALRDALGDLVGADVRFDLAVDHPNGH